MIEYKVGDICEAFKESEIDVLIHGCNAQGVMGSGIARQIKAEFPLAFNVYKRIERNQGLYLGDYSTAKIDDGYIINFITQDHYLPRDFCHFNYKAFETGLKEIDRIFAGVKIGMPKIGAGLAGGDWVKIEAIINEVFGERIVYVYTLE